MDGRQDCTQWQHLNSAYWGLALDHILGRKLEMLTFNKVSNQGKQINSAYCDCIRLTKAERGQDPKLLAGIPCPGNADLTPQLAVPIHDPPLYHSITIG